MGVLNQVATAKEMVSELLQTSSRSARSPGSPVRQLGGEAVCSSTVTLLTNLVTALAMSDIEQTQVFAVQLISSPTLSCSSAERGELAINLEELASKQGEEEEKILQLENQLEGLVVAIRQLEEQVAALTSQLVAQLGLQIDGGDTELQVDDSGEVPLILQDSERLQMIMEEEDELPFALPIHVIASADFLYEN